ncbi:hypothetical protein LDENG_00156240 [Lucifuga dentata]|nr:hypothetical protein LDENG_00156240 [Lucifuga dentata]
MAKYFLLNKYIDTSCQKAGVPGFPGCVEHSAMIWEQIQTTKREKSDLHVVWLDLANAYGSVPHQLITFALNFFHIPTPIQSLVSAYFGNFYVCYITQQAMTGWWQLQKGIAMGCSISPILFTAAFEIILIGGRQMVRGVRTQSGHCLPALRSYMDDVTTLLQTAACTNRLLKRLEELLTWAWMKIKPAKSRSLSIWKGARSDNISFSVGGEKIPLLAEQSVQSLGRLYTADLSVKHAASSVVTKLSEGLGKIDQSHLSGKFKLGLPRCLSNAALFGRNTLQLPLKLLSLGYRQEKVRLLFELRDSSDPLVQKAKAPVRTECKWRAEEAVEQAISQLKQQEIVGWLQPGKTRLGWGPAPKLWSKASKKERKELVVSEVSGMDEEKYKIRAVSQCQQGRWELGSSDQQSLNMGRYVEDSAGKAELPHKNPSLQHILTGCKSALTWYRWCHDRVLRKLAEVLEACRLEANKTGLSSIQSRIHFIRQGAESLNIAQKEWSVLTPGCEWNMRVDLDHQLKFPHEIATTVLWPDIVLWSIPARTVILAELTVPWEEGMEAAFERKKEKYSELSAECMEAEWKASTIPVEIGCYDFIRKSTQQFLKVLGITWSRQRKALRELAEEAEQGSFWLWLRRNDAVWGKQGS